MTDDPTVHGYDEGQPYHPSPTSTPVDVQEPHVPWYKDEKLRLWGEHGPSSASIIRALIITVVIALCVMGWVSYRAYSYGSAAHKATNTLQQDNQELNDTITKNHKTRIANDAEVNHELQRLRVAIATNKSGTRDLACSVVIFIETQPGFKPDPFTQFLSDRYHCKNYHPLQTVFPRHHPGNGPRPSSASSEPLPPGPSTPVSSATPTEPTGPTRTVTSTRPAPPRKTVTSTHTQPPPPTPTHIVCVLNVCVG